MIKYSNKELTAGSTWLEVLKQAGLRITEPRRNIVNIVSISEFAKSPQEIFEEVKLKFPGIGLVTVYRTLECLEAHGLIQRVHHQAGCHMFLRKHEGHAHLLVCAKCNRVISVSGDDLTLMVSMITHQSGFIVQEHWLQFLGICPACQETEKGTN